MRPRVTLHRTLKFKDDVQKLAFLRGVVKKGAVDPNIVELGSTLVRNLRPDDWRGMAREIHRFVREGIRYQHDPDRHEQLADAWSVVERGRDDCDGKAVLATSLLRAVGLDAELRPVFLGPMMKHVQSQVRWPGSEHEPHAMPGGWVLCETTIDGCELGQDPQSVPRNHETGRLPLA